MDSSRTAPIAIAIPIAPKPPRRPGTSTSSERRGGGGGGGRFEIGPPSSSSSSASAAAAAAAAKVHRCHPAREEEGEGVVEGVVECCPASSPPSPPTRKRKLNGGHSADSGKRTPPKTSGRHPDSSGSSCLEDIMANVGGPTMLRRTLGLQEDRHSRYIGLTTDFEPSLLNLSPFDPHDESESLLARGTLRKVSDSVTFLMLPDHGTPGHEHVSEDLDAIERIVAPHGRDLVRLYFEVVHPGLPIVQRGVFLERYERSYRELSPPLLAVVYLLATNWWDHDERLSKLPRPDVRELERITRATLEDAMFRPKLSTVQAGLLLSQRPEGDQWAPTAQLVAIAQELGLHLDCSGWKIPPWEKGLRRRLAWALYVQDKWGALVHGRPSHIFPSNWAVRPLEAGDFPDVDWDERNPHVQEEREDVEKGRLVFMRFVLLSQILAEILDTFYSLQAVREVAETGPHATQAVLSLAKPIQLKLKEWYSGLPATVRLDSSSSSSSPSPSPSPSYSYSYPASRPSPRLSCIGYLHLGYFAAEITLHRRIIRSLSSSSSSSSSSSFSSSDSYVQHICRSAAKARLISAMDFVNRLTPPHLRSFWFFASRANFALIGTFGSLLWATSPGREEAEWYRRRLGEYRWTLSVSAKPGLTGFAMAMLDISTGLLRRLPEKPEMSSVPSAPSVPVSSVPSVPSFQSLQSASFSGAGSVLGSFSNLASANGSGMQSPESESDSDDYGTRRRG